VCAYIGAAIRRVSNRHGGYPVNRAFGVAAATFSILFLATTGAHAQECGDLDNNGSIVASDALLLLNRAVGLPTPPLSCPANGLPATGQMTSYGPGSDGDVQAGAALSYADNGDGTITDLNTGLMWEKKDDSGGIHAQDNFYTWTTATNNMDGTIVTTFLDTLNDVAGGGTSCFAGHCDWRIPNRKELDSILDLEVSVPSIDAVFHQAGTCAGCTDVTLATCSCTAPTAFYWSSTVLSTTPLFTWGVSFNSGRVASQLKTNVNAVRAVRGGL
jgi:hypothetical protein